MYVIVIAEDNLSNIYTVEEAVQKIGFGVFQILMSLFCGTIWVNATKYHCYWITMYLILQLTEAFEVMILAILSAALTCEWNLSSVQEASITTVTIMMTRSSYLCILVHVQVVFFGFLFGNPVWGIVADKFGRKKVHMYV